MNDRLWSYVISFSYTIYNIQRGARGCLHLWLWLARDRNGDRLFFGDVLSRHHDLSHWHHLLRYAEFFLTHPNNALAVRLGSPVATVLCSTAAQQSTSVLLVPIRLDCHAGATSV